MVSSLLATNSVAMATAQPHHLASIENCFGSDDDPAINY
jgi:hypothetical protein